MNTISPRFLSNAPFLGLSCAIAALAASAPMVASAQDVAAGERLFRQRCAACHAVQAGRNVVGPHLSGIVGRKAGGAQGARYSQGMQNLGVTWDAAQLEKYLTNPSAMVPGTTMAVAVPNAAERASIVAYLATLRAPQ